ncbi:LINE-1 retrotransposable element ORF1 protein [Collichthys lucidus]|uniref:LINE-1 retrotransposable element ORF1 protein n=1 Tax=Collichthys lucidus TaxID=240159 RepID=A0A4V6ALN2_COLLU|nr:LINE-1 retrotransposable element ORF1 protein [Collichthys lucidus]
MEGRPIRFTPNYSPHTFRRRLAFSEAMDALQKLNFRTFLLYPAKLKVMRGGVSDFFNTPREHRRVLWAGLTAAKKMLALRWQPPHSLAWQQWANSFLEIVLMEWSVARMHGASHKTLQGWEAAHKINQKGLNMEELDDVTVSVLNVSPCTSTPVVKKTLQLPSPPQYVIYTDTVLELACKHHFEMACTGREGESAMSKELRCRLVRNTVTSMISILRASHQGEELRYPSKHEVTAMAKRLVEYYPMLQEKDKPIKHMSMYSYLQKRILNVKTPQKRQGPRPERSSSTKRRHNDFSPSDQGEDYDADSSGGSTILLPPGSSSEDDSSAGKDSLITQARHYKTVQEMYKKPKPNQDAVCQILDLEFQARRAFIDSAILKEENRLAKIFEAYPCFRELHHVMDKLRRILDKDDSKFLDEPTEEPAIYLQKRTLFSPVLVFDGSRCLLAIGNTPVLKKIYGDGQGTMQYVTSVLNEWGQFVTTAVETALVIESIIAEFRGPAGLDIDGIHLFKSTEAVDAHWTIASKHLCCMQVG